MAITQPITIIINVHVYKYGGKKYCDKALNKKLSICGSGEPSSVWKLLVSLIIN